MSDRRSPGGVSAGIIAASPVSVYSSPYGGNELFDLSLVKLQEKSQVKIGTEKLPNDLKKFFLGNVLVGRPLHGL